MLILIHFLVDTSLAMSKSPTPATNNIDHFQSRSSIAATDYVDHLQTAANNVAKLVPKLKSTLGEYLGRANLWVEGFRKRDWSNCKGKRWFVKARAGG